MAYYSKKRRRRSGGNIVNIVVGVLVAFLLIGFLGSLFREAPIDPDLDATKAPVTDVTEPEVTLLSFIVRGTTYYCEEGMTWQEFIDSDYSQACFEVVDGRIRYDDDISEEEAWIELYDLTDSSSLVASDVINTTHTFGQ